MTQARETQDKLKQRLKSLIDEQQRVEGILSLQEEWVEKGREDFESFLGLIKKEIQKKRENLVLA